MGVRGLERFIEKNGVAMAHPAGLPQSRSEEAESTVKAWIEEYLRRDSDQTSQRPPYSLSLSGASEAFMEERAGEGRLEVVIDGNGLLYHLYCRDHSMGSRAEWLIGGEYRALHVQTQAFFRSFTTLGLDVRVVFDGPREKRKEETNLKRMNQSASSAASIHAQLVKGVSFERVKSSSPFVIPLLASTALKQSIKRIESSAVDETDVTLGRVSVTYAPGEADAVIAQYCAETDRCIAVIAQDSDFLVFPDIRYIPFRTLSAGSGWLTAACFHTDSTIASLGFPSNMSLVAFAMALGTDHVRLEEAHLDDDQQSALAGRVRGHFTSGDFSAFLEKFYDSNVDDRSVSDALYFYCSYGKLKAMVDTWEIAPHVEAKLTSPFSADALVGQTEYYTNCLIDDQFFDAVKQGRLLMPMPIANPGGDRNPAALLSSLRKRLYLCVNGGQSLAHPIKEYYAGGSIIRLYSNAPGALTTPMPSFGASVAGSSRYTEKEKLQQMRKVMWVLFGASSSQQGELEMTDIQGWESPFGPILLTVRTLLFSAVGALLRPWEYHVVLAYFAAASCRPADKKARALGTARVNKGVLDRFLWFWSVIEMTVQHLNWSVGALGLVGGQLDVSSWLSSTNFLHFYKEMSFAMDHLNIRQDQLSTDRIRRLVREDLFLSDSQCARAYELLERIVRLKVPTSAVTQLGSELKEYARVDGRNEWEEWMWMLENRSSFATKADALFGSQGEQGGKEKQGDSQRKPRKRKKSKTTKKKKK